jgi:hypothetical protein
MKERCCSFNYLQAAHFLLLIRIQSPLRLFSCGAMK